MKEIDPFLGELGQPLGVKSYKTFHSTGEDFLQTYLGMIGIPMDLVPEFPVQEKLVLLTESAKADPDLVSKMKKHLIAGNTIMITSGLLRTLQHEGLDEIVELRYSDKKALVKDFKIGWGPYYQAKAEMLIPQIHYLTNDSWEEISAMDETNGWPILHSAAYGNGTLYVLTLPESFTDLYNLPAEVITRIKQTLMSEMPVSVESPGQVSLFVYDNDTFIVESFLHEPVDIKIIVQDRVQKLQDLRSGDLLSGEAVKDWRGEKTGKLRFPASLKPHSFRVFRCQENP